MNKKKYPFTIPADGINYLKEYRENFEKCTAVMRSKNKNKTRGKVVNVFMPEYGRNGKKGIIITIEYKTKEGNLKIGECYMDFPNTYPGLNEETEIYYIDDNYNFVYIDDIQYVDKETFIDSKEKLEAMTKDFKPVIVSTIIGIILGLFACMAVDVEPINKYIILISTIIHYVLLMLNIKHTKSNILFIQGMPLLLNLMSIFIYTANNLTNLDFDIYITYGLHLAFVIGFFVFIKKKK